MSEMSPELGGEKSDRALSGSEPLVAGPNWSGMGKKQWSVLRFLAKRGPEVPYVEVWKWIARYDFPDYEFRSYPSQATVHEYIASSTWNILQSLVRRRLVLLVPDPDEPKFKDVRLRVEPQQVFEMVAKKSLVAVCPECDMPSGLAGKRYGGCCSPGCEIQMKARNEVKQ